MIKKNNSFLFFSLKEVRFQKNRNRLISNGFSLPSDVLFLPKNSIRNNVKVLPVYNSSYAFKYVYNIKSLAVRYFDYIFNRSFFDLKRGSLLYSCKYKSKKNINMLRRYKTRKKLTDALYDSIFFSGLSLSRLFFTKRFLLDNIRLHNNIFLKKYYKSLFLNKGTKSINNLFLIKYLHESYKNKKKIYNFFNNSKKCHNWI